MSNRLRIGFLADSLSRNGGGLQEVQLALAKQLLAAGHDLSIFGIHDDFFEADLIRWQPIVPFAAKSMHLFNLSYSPALMKAALKSNAEIMHLHTLWKYSSKIVYRWSKRKSSPYVVTPHGMLEPWAKKNSGLKKKIAGLLYENRMLRGTACLHVFTEKELQDIRSIGLTCPIAIIPNGIDLETIAKKRQERMDLPRTRLMLYLGRLHPKKGLSMLLKAWSKIVALNDNGGYKDKLDPAVKGTWKLVIAGWDQNGHESELKKLCDELGLSRADVSAEDFVTGHRNVSGMPQVIFVGPAFCEIKSRLYSMVDSFVLPSLSEGLPMTILEAWANCLPVLMTESCNLLDGLRADAALITAATEGGIASALEKFVNLSPERLEEMGQNGRVLVERKYQWRTITEELVKVYSWILGKGPIPECVHLT